MDWCSTEEVVNMGKHVVAPVAIHHPMATAFHHHEFFVGAGHFIEDLASALGVDDGVLGCLDD